MGLAEGAQPLLDQGRVGQHPAVQGGVVDLQAALEEQLLDVAVAQRIAHRYHETAWRISVASKWRPLKSSFDRRFSRLSVAMDKPAEPVFRDLPGPLIGL